MHTEKLRSAEHSCLTNYTGFFLAVSLWLSNYDYHKLSVGSMVESVKSVNNFVTVTLVYNKSC